MTEIARLRAALEFYRANWTFTRSRYGGLEWKPTEALLDDCGNTAREALAATADAGEANPLDQAYSRINALAGPAGEYDDFGRGINYAVEQALAIIEELGGRDPAKRGRS